MGLGFSILQIDFQNILALNVTFIEHNKNYQKSQQKISTGISFWKKKKGGKSNKQWKPIKNQTKKQNTQKTGEVYVVRKTAGDYWIC